MENITAESRLCPYIWKSIFFLGPLSSSPILEIWKVPKPPAVWDINVVSFSDIGSETTVQRERKCIPCFQKVRTKALIFQSLKVNGIDTCKSKERSISEHIRWKSIIFRIPEASAPNEDALLLQLSNVNKHN